MSQSPQGPQLAAPRQASMRQIVGAGGGVAGTPPPVAPPGGSALLPAAGVPAASPQASQGNVGGVSQQGLYRLECGRCNRLLGLASPSATVSLVCGRCKTLNLIVVPLHLKPV